MKEQKQIKETLSRALRGLGHKILDEADTKDPEKTDFDLLEAVNHLVIAARILEKKDL